MITSSRVDLESPHGVKVCADTLLDEPSLAKQVPPTFVPVPDIRPGWKSDEMTLVGTTIAADPQYQTFVLLVTEAIDSDGTHTAISPPRKKRVYLQPDAMVTTPDGLISRWRLSSLKGTVTQVTGFDQGPGTPLEANDVLVTGKAPSGQAVASATAQ